MKQERTITTTEIDNYLSGRNATKKVTSADPTYTGEVVGYRLLAGPGRITGDYNLPSLPADADTSIDESIALPHPYPILKPLKNVTILSGEWELVLK